MREAMAKFVEGNFDNFQKWIDKVAKEDPAKASDLYLKAAEFNLPKLTRTELRADPTASTRTSLIVSFVGAPPQPPRQAPEPVLMPRPASYEQPLALPPLAPLRIAAKAKEPAGPTSTESDTSHEAWTRKLLNGGRR